MPTGVSWGQFVQPVSIPRFTCIICAKFIPNRSSRLTTFPRLLNCWPPKFRRGVSWSELFLAYVHSQMKPQTCTEFCANWSSSLTASPDIWICDPLKPPKMPPWGIVGRLVFSLYPFPDESADVNQSWCQAVQPFDSFSRLLNVWPPKTSKCPPCVSKGNLFGVYPFPDESAHVCQIWCQSVQPFDSLPKLLNVWPLNPPPKCPPCVSRGNLFGVYPFPYECAHVCQIWCQSAQPFGSFSRICAKVSSAFRRCTRRLAQKHA